MAVEHRYAITVRADAQTSVHETLAIPFSKQFLRLGLHLFFFAADEWHYIPLYVQGSDAGVARAGHGLKRQYENFLQPERVGQRLEKQNQPCGGTVWICEQESGVGRWNFFLD